MGLFDLKKKKVDQKKKEIAPKPIATPEEPPQDITLKRNYDGSFLKYQYTDIPVKLRKEADISNILCRPAKLKLSDEGKLRVYVDGNRIGRIEQETVISVATEWLKKEYIYKAYITSVDDETRKVLMGVFFYKNEYDPRLQKHPDAPEFRLLGGRNEDIRWARFDSQRGDRCELDMAANGRYSVYDGGAIIGYLPTAAAKLVAEIGEDVCDIFVSNVTKSAEGNEVDVRIFE